MFSKRTEWNQELNDLHQMLEAIKFSGADVIDLTESNPTRCGFSYPHNWITALLNPKNLNYVPDALGMMPVRELVGGLYQHPPENVALTASTSESYSFLFRLLLNPGDRVLIPKPSYPLFQFLLELNDAAFDYYPIRFDGGAWSINFEALEKLVTKETKAIVLVNPNNPTGSYVKTAELDKLNQFCQKHNLTIISDEVFYHYSLKVGDYVSLKGNEHVLTFVLGGLSKALALPQMKLGWILASGPAIHLKGALTRLEIIADTYLSVGTPVQNALSVWLNEAHVIQDQIKARVSENLRTLKESNINVLPVEGGWNAIIHIQGINEESFVLELLRAHHILVHPGFFFDFEADGYVVVSLLPNNEHFVKMISILGGINGTSKLG